MKNTAIAISWALIATLLLIILSNKCTTPVAPTDNYSIIKDSLNREKIRNEVIRDSLHKKIELSNYLFDSLEKKNQDLKNQISEIENSKPKIPETILSRAEYFNSRYNTNDNYYIDSTVNISSNTSYKIIDELLDKDILKRSDRLKDKIIETQIEQMFIKEENYKSLSLILSSTKSELLLSHQVIVLADNNIKSLNKDLKQKNRNNTMLIVSIPAAIIAGILVGVSVK